MSASEEDGGLIYGLEFQCRALTSVNANADEIKFLVGTQSLKTDNQVHLLTLDEDTGTLSKQVYSHPAGEVWDLEASPTGQSSTSTLCTHLKTWPTTLPCHCQLCTPV